MRPFQIFDRLVTSRIAVGLVLFALLALLIWFGGPKLAIDGAEPLASQTNRLIAIAVLAVVFLGLEAFRRWRLNRLNRRILSSLESLDAASGPARGIGRVREGYAMFREALRTRGGARLRNRRHLYEQPWYLVLGEPGSGRFAALANSGMEFVLDAASLERVPGSEPGRGGECGWWVTDDAVFVVAPAEFVTEPGPTQAAEWHDLLDCLKSARRRYPLNGIILTIPATCMPFEAIELDVATRMRERVQEAMAHFSMVLPIYLLVTKCDRIAGFSEYFSGLDAEDRARPLGVTLPPGRPRPAFGRMRGADAFAAGATAVAAYAERYRAFVASLAAWMPSRLSAPGAKRLVLEQPAIDVRTDELDASAARARLKVEQLHLFSRLVAVVAGGFDLVADRVKRIARLETTSTGDSVRTVRNTDTLRAGHILHDASEVMSLRSDVAVIEARGDVRVNGERITVG